MPSARVRRFPKKRVGFVAAGRSSIRVITEIPPMIDGPCSWNAHVLPQDRAFCPISSVAGAYAPAFVERKISRCRMMIDVRRVAGAYAPAFVERGCPPTAGWTARACVAGAYAPAFVERRSARSGSSTRPRVAGAYAPAFVERTPMRGPRRLSVRVSPELMLRPSLSAAEGVCRRGRGAGGVAGAYAPAFVERTGR